MNRFLPSGRRQALWFAVRLNIYGFGLLALWTTLNTVLLPQRVDSVVPASFRGTALGVITFLGIGLAAVVQPVAGRISDRAPLAHRRKPFIIWGTAIGLVALGLVGLAPSFLWLLIAYVALQLAANVAQAAFQAFIPDQVTPDNVGLASGVKNGLGVLGSAVGLVGAGLLLKTLGGMYAALGYLGLLLALVAYLTHRWVPDSPDVPDDARARGLGDLVHPGRMAHGFIAAFREHRVFRLAIVMRFLFFLGIYPVQRLFLYYLSARFDIQSVSQVSVFIVIGVIVAAVAAWAAGLLSDRFGRLAVLRVVIVGGAVGVLGLAFAPVLLLVAVAGLLAAAAFGAFQSVNWAQLSDETPQGHGAEYLGLSNLATAGSSAIAGLFGPLSDLLQAWLPAGAYHITFGLAALIALSGLLPLHRLGEMRQDSDQAPPHAEHAENAEKRTSHREAGTGQGKKGGKHRSPA